MHPGSTKLPVCAEEIFLDVNGNRTRVLRAGSDSSFPIVLLHGLGSNANTWLPTLPVLAPTHRVYALDLLGCGLTDKPEDVGYSLDEMLFFFTAFMDVLGLERADLNGWSMGGRLALCFAKQDPARVRKLVLTAPAGLGTEAHILSRMTVGLGASALAYLPYQPGNWAYYRAAWHSKRAPGAMVAETAKVMRLPGAYNAFMKQLSSLIDTNGYRLEPWRELLDGLEKVTCPVLALWGRQDTMTPLAPGNSLRDLLPNYRLEVIDECGHHPHSEHTQLYNDLLVTFLADD